MIFKKLKEIVVEQLQVEESKVQMEATFRGDLEADSLDLFEIVMSLEEEFDVEIPNEDLEKIKTIKDAIDYITKKNN